MNSIHFHFNGDVNINLSLPDSADRPGYKKLVDSLEEYLHDAAEEAAVTEAEADSIVMVMRPDKTPEVMQETQCWEEIESKGGYDCLEVVSDDALDVEGLTIVFNGRHVLNLGRERYPRQLSGGGGRGGHRGRGCGAGRHPRRPGREELLLCPGGRGGVFPGEQRDEARGAERHGKRARGRDDRPAADRERPDPVPA